MIEQPEWVFYTDIEWNDPKFNKFNVDTRDFCCGYIFNNLYHKDFATLSKYPDFFHTEQEIKDLLDRYFAESGGKCEWRFFNLEGVENWNMKYIRIWRTELGFMVCDGNDHALRKDFLSKPVEQKHLNAH